MIDLSAIPTETKLAWRQFCFQRLESMRGYRLPWWGHWGALAEMFLPRRYRYFITANNFARGTQINSQIVDETGEIAARTLATGLQANLTSPTKPWLVFELAGRTVPEGSAAAQYLSTCSRIVLEILAQSNFYTAIGSAYHDLGVFGSAALVQYEDPDTVVWFYNPPLGEFMFGLNGKRTVDTLYLEFTYTIQSLVDEFGLDNVSLSSAIAYRAGGSSRATEVVVCCAIEPNDDLWQLDRNFGKPVPAKFAYREIYWEQAASLNGAQPTPDRVSILRASGFNERPFEGLRWDVTSNDPYGRSPGMDALPAVRQLQIEQRRKAEAIDKLVRPPMVGSVAMKNEPASILPGGITYVADPAANGFKPAFTVDPKIAEMSQDILQVQERVKLIMFNNLFTPIMDESKVQTATWVDSVNAERLILLGPVVERLQSEGLSGTVERTFAIANRRGLLPEPPPEIANFPLTIRYVSIFAQAQAAATTASIERVFGFAGNLVAVVPRVMDNLDADMAIEEYASNLRVPPSIVRSKDMVNTIRANQAAQQQAAAALTSGATLASGAKTLSETDVGGGQSALQAMISPGGVQ